MKKFLMAIFALVVATTVATAGVGILWSAQWGAYDHAETDLVGGSAALLDSYSAIWQLIYAGADNTIDPASTSAGGAGIADNYVTDDDVVWAERTIAQGGGTAPEDSTVWDNWMTPQSGYAVFESSWATAGFVYQRVFEGTPAANSWYYTSGLLAFDGTFVVGGGSPPQDFFLGSDSAGFQPTSQFPAAVPEPATMGLLGLGALVMAIRRRRS